MKSLPKSIRFDPTEEKAIRLIAVAWGRTPTEAIRRAVILAAELVTRQVKEKPESMKP